MAATQNYSLPLPQLGEPADIRVLDQGTEMIDGIMHGNRTMVAPAWVSTETYNTGSRVVYLGEYYKCKEDNVTGAWDATKWDKTTVGEDIEGLGTGGASALADLDDVEITSPTVGQALLFDEDEVWKNQDLPDVSVTKEASGNPIEIDDAAAAPLVKCVTQITGYQEGTGTPSPDNIRPIVAYTEGEIEVSDGDGNTTTHTTTYPNAIYRGSEDCVNGEVTSDMTVIDLGDLNWFYDSTVNSMVATVSNAKFPLSNDVAINAVCSICQIIPASQRATTTGIRLYMFISAPDIYIRDSGYTSASDFKTDMAGQKLAYELATPTTSSVTPTNLPIKSLSGYTHIESSTGDMEVEYIRNTYQPIVDLIQSSSHVYSTAEQVVGKWIDGSDLYEKTYSGLSLTVPKTYDNTWTNTNLLLGDIDTIISGSCIDDLKQSFPASVAKMNGDTNIGIILGANPSPRTVTTLIIRYTKTTTTRSLSAPVTSQKAQIEPLSEKEEETPVEEEKAVEKPVEEKTEEENEEEKKEFD